MHTVGNTEVPLPFRALLGGVYGPNHLSFKSRKENLNYVLEQINKPENDSVIFLLRMPLVERITEDQADTQLIENTKGGTKSPIAFFIPIEFTHFMNITSLSKNEETGTYKLVGETYGRQISCEIKEDALIKNFDGAIIAVSPAKILQLQQLKERPNDPLKSNKSSL